MKKVILVLLTFVPIPAGYLVNLFLPVPMVGALAYYVIPLIVLAFWFWLGGCYAKTGWGAVRSVLTGSVSGILSLALYLWQFWIQSDETRNLALAGLSQMYASAAPAYLTARLAILFEARPDYAGKAAMTALQVISLILMMAVFTAGYLRGRERIA